MTATGLPAPTYQWFFDGTLFNGATSSTLSLANVQSTDAGDYTVVVTNPAGTVTSNKATLTVSSDPVTPPPSTSSGGGGAVSLWFYLALLALGIGRVLRRQTVQTHVGRALRPTFKSPDIGDKPRLTKTNSRLLRPGKILRSK